MSETRGLVILDFGSQYTQLIARRFRELGFFSELLPYNIDLDVLKEKKPLGIILSGGPSSVFGENSPQRDVKELLEMAPVLGICYGMQLLTHQLGGKVSPSKQREYGHAHVHWTEHFSNFEHSHSVWMSHGDVVETPPVGAEIIGRSEGGHPAALKGEKFWALQFHPEVAHTDHGSDLLRSFAEDFCGMKKNWTTQSIKDHLLEDLKNQVGESDHVLCALSGGVDSTVTATLLTQALGGDRVHCVFVDTGLLRKNEFEDVLEMYKELGLNVKGVQAEERFLSGLKGLTDPEEKRKKIGHLFIDVFKDAIKDIGDCDWLAQGTLYPDVIESVSPRGQSVTIKSHHNVGGLPKDLGLKLVEPLKELFKDEVRRLGDELGLPHKFLWRHPFPGPGLAIRILGEVTKERLEILKEADDIYIKELKGSGLYDQIWQAFSVLLPVKTVGVQGDGRTYDAVLALRAVTSVDGMTANWFDFDHKFLSKLSNRITNEVQGVNRVVYDVTSKPPGTIEWE
ncbi:MAG: glutamine-hydrolyzing GMP synthase [Bdellovibrionaceae bacterium]|nr:glutamine-hydrolyzing GMP synthase [Pseudobdellovibrionaceae bacterium]|tara:strand:- start:3544 stop:5073 length:1530 start_codon:yes stop_codon:yes gene_type:complete